MYLQNKILVPLKNEDILMLRKNLSIQLIT